jgi:fructose-1,6-bisphosphatase/inositol monophosphatase family enzyme
MATNHDDDARLALSLVREAGRLAARMRHEGVAGLGTEQKTSVSDVVTAADRAAEELVTRRLGEERPDDAVLGEEGASRTGTSGRTWVIDPVDGTYNFVQGLEWWCSALALETDGEPVLGAVHHPASDTTYVGGTGVAPTASGEPLDVLVDRPLAQSCLASYLHPPLLDTPVAAAFGRFAGHAATLRMLGSGTMDAMAVARGQLHVVCQHSVPPWDWMPGAAIIRAVGGEARHVEAAGRTWYVAGVPTAVAEVTAALLDG